MGLNQRPMEAFSFQYGGLTSVYASKKVIGIRKQRNAMTPCVGRGLEVRAQVSCDLSTSSTWCIHGFECDNVAWNVPLPSARRQVWSDGKLVRGQSGVKEKWLFVLMRTVFFFVLFRSFVGERLFCIKYCKWGNGWKIQAKVWYRRPVITSSSIVILWLMVVGIFQCHNGKYIQLKLFLFVHG